MGKMFCHGNEISLYTEVTGFTGWTLGEELERGLSGTAPFCYRP